VYKGELNDETASHFAVNENNRMQDYFIRTNFPDAEITYYPSIEDCLAAIDSGKAGSTTLNGLRANNILKNSKYRRLSLIQLSQNDDRSFGVKIGNEGLLRLLNRGISIIGSDYIQNLAYVGFMTDGTPIIVIFDYALCTSGLEAEGKNKENSVFPATFECYADLSEGVTDTLPYHIYTAVATV
jgi:hypothetical protein